MSRPRRNDIACANCLHCKQFVGWAKSGARELRVKCTQGHWQTPSEKLKTYNAHTVLQRRRPTCDDYEPMGDPSWLSDPAAFLLAEKGM